MPEQPLPALATLELCGLELSGTDALLQRLPALRRLVLERCRAVPRDELAVCLSHTPMLQHVSMTRCDNACLLDVASAPALTHLTCTGTDMAELDLSLVGGQQRTALQHLDISCSMHLTAVDLVPVPNLSHLACAACDNLNMLDIQACTQLQHLNLSCSPILPDVVDVSHCAATLQYLNINVIGGELQGLGQCTRLQELHWKDFQHDELDLQPLSNLTTLDVSHSSLKALDQLPTSLQFLDCSNSLDLQQLSLAALTSLAQLDFSDCQSLIALQLPPVGAGAQLVQLQCRFTRVLQLDLRLAVSSSCAWSWMHQVSRNCMQGAAGSCRTWS